MKKELKNALRNIDLIVGKIALPRDQHVQLVKDIDLLRSECEKKKKS